MLIKIKVVEWFQTYISADRWAVNDSRYRIFVDFCNLSYASKRPKYFIPRVEEHINLVGDATHLLQMNQN